MATRKSACAWDDRLLVVMKEMTVGCPRIDSAVTGVSSTASKSKSTARRDGGALTPGGSTRAADLAPPQPPTRLSAPTTAASAARETTTGTRLLVALLPHELVFTVCKENVESGQRAVAARHVLLKLHLLVAGELRVGIDLLLEHAQAIADHHDLVKERVERDALLLQ